MQKQQLQGAVRILSLLAIVGVAIAWVRWQSKDQGEAPTTSEDWAHRVDSGDAGERRMALMNLRPGADAQTDAAIEAATRALKDPDPSVRNEAAVALSRLATPPIPGSSAPDPARTRAVSASLLAAFRDDEDPSVRGSAATSLSFILAALEKSGTRPADLPEDHPLNPRTLVPAFDVSLSSDPANQVALIAAIEKLGPVPMDAPPGLLSALDAPTHFVRGQALKALSHFSGGVDRAIPVLLRDVVTNTDRFPPDYAAIAHDMHPSTAAVPTLVEALGSPDGIVRETAETLLAGIEPTPKSAAPAVIAAVRRQLEVSGDSADTPDVEDPGPAQPKGVTPSSGIKREEPPPGSVSPDLARLLAKAAPPEESLPLLLRLLKRKDRASRSAAAEGLAVLGPRAHAALPTLIDTMKQALADGGRAASGYGARTALALGRIASRPTEGTASNEAVVAVLTEALKARPASIRAGAARALGDLGPRAASASDGLRELLDDRNKQVAESARSALDKIAPASPTSDVSRPS